MAGPYRLDARRFNEWWTRHVLINEAQTKEGREKMRLRVDARRFNEAERVVAQRHQASSEAYSAMDADGDRDEDEEYTGIGITRVTEYDPDGPQHALLDGARAGAAVFTNPQTLLALLSPDDPRAIFVRAGGRLDASGNPIPTASQRRAEHARKRAQAAYIPPERLGWQPNAIGIPLDPLRPAPTQGAMRDPLAAPAAPTDPTSGAETTMVPPPSPSSSSLSGASSSSLSGASFTDRLKDAADMPTLPPLPY